MLIGMMSKATASGFAGNIVNAIDIRKMLETSTMSLANR